MIQPPIPETGPSFMMLEGGLTVIAVAIATCCPKLGGRLFSRIEHAFGPLAAKKGLAVLTVGVSALLLRLAILPWCPVPTPFIHDCFSYLLAADTFAAGRLTNPTPVMWQHFETFHTTMQPTYMSMYFPAQGLVLAAGKVLFGHPWFGLLLVTSIMCAAICWMLQAWLPARWALLGGVIAVLHLGLFSYWINTYSGAGSIAALGGALVLGAFPRLIKTTRAIDAVLLTLGAILLANSRPYEGLLLCLPVAFAMVSWLLFSKNKPSFGLLLRRAVMPALMLLLAGSWMAYYNYRNFGNALTLPYKADRVAYAVAPHFIWQAPHPMPVYRHAVMREFYVGWEFDYYKKLRNVSGFITESPLKLVRAVLYFAGLALLPPLIMLRRALPDRRIRFLVICSLVLALGMLAETWLIPHYISPFTAVFYAIGLQCMRHLRVWKPGGQHMGTTMVRLLVAVCLVLTVVRTVAMPLHLRLASWPSMAWFGSQDFGTRRASIETQLENLPGEQLAIVHYSANHDVLDEWVFNRADIAHAKVIWARDMGAEKNEELVRYYSDRTVWLVQPDNRPVGVTSYSLLGQEFARLR